jgi:hypothetical protein
LDFYDRLTRYVEDQSIKASQDDSARGRALGFLPSEGYPLKPSELFRRQCYFTCWYDRMSLDVRRYLGTANILWSSNFPLATSTWPNTRRHGELSFAGIPDDEKRQMQWQNAAELYAL